MKKIVLTFGLIAGLITAGTMLTMITLASDDMHFDHGVVIGYTSMLIAFILIYFGIRSYRDQNGGVISFGKAFQIGILITLVASTMYVATWEIYYYTAGQDFIAKYAAHSLEKARERGASPAEIAAEQEKMEQFAKMYKNPLVNIGLGYMEILPVGLIVTLVSAAILRRKIIPERSEAGA